MSDDGSVPPLAAEVPAPAPAETTPVPATETPVAEQVLASEAEVTPQIQNSEVSPQEPDATLKDTEAAPPESPEVEVVAESSRAQPVSAASAPIPVAPEFDIRSLKPLAVAAIRAKKKARLERIFELKSLNRIIKNDDVERHLKVCDKTAGAYLSELARQGRLEKIGIGRGTRYRFPR